MRKNVRKVRENTYRLDVQLTDQIFRSAELFLLYIFYQI